MRADASVLHLDLDAFFASVEQRDKPSLRGRAVVVGGIDGRGVVSTASYEARRFGVRSAMATAHARRLLPAGAAYLVPRFEAYRASSQVVMDLLGELSPLVERVSIDEAFVDLAAGGLDTSTAALEDLATGLRARVVEATGGLTASIGIGSSKLVAKVASDLHKPDHQTIIAAGTELERLHPLPVTALGGVGPATQQRLRTIGVTTVGELHGVEESTLVQLFGTSHGTGLHRLARAQDDRPLVAHREAKSVSAEDTFATDVTAVDRLHAEIDRLAARVGTRLRGATTAGRTVTLKVRRHDFSTVTRSATLSQPVDDDAIIASTARRLLAEAPTEGGVRLLGVGVSGLTDFVQADLFSGSSEHLVADDVADDVAGVVVVEVADELGEAVASVAPLAPVEVTMTLQPAPAVSAAVWRPGQDVVHDDHGAGWVWGSGRGLVTVRFEGPLTGPGPVRTFAVDDAALRHGSPPGWVEPADGPGLADAVDGAQHEGLRDP